MTDIYALPFDQYQRYRLVADLLVKALGARSGRILDVGGRTELLGRFLEGHEIFLVDVEISDAKGLILGSGAALPFADNSFDAVCAFDTLEHIPVVLRDAFVAECARVSRGFVFLAGPYDSPEVARSEELLQEFLKQKIGQPHRYLNEHRELGLPDRSRAMEILEQAGGQVGVVGHANLERWLLAMCLEMYMESDPLLQPLARPFYRFYNRLVFPHDHAGPVYRHVVMASFGGGALPTTEDVLQAPALPAETERQLQTFAKDWMCVDREHQVWKPEFARLTGIIGDLEKDLVEHKQSLQTSGADLTAHKDTLGAVRMELSELSKGSAQQLHELNAQFQAHSEQATHLVTTLKEQSEGSQAAIESLRSHYEGAMEAAQVAGETVQTELGAELTRTQEHAGNLQEQTIRLQEHAANLEAERGRANKVLIDLEGENIRLDGQAQGLGVKVQGLADEALRMKRELESTQGQLENTQEQLEGSQEQLESTQEQLENTQGQLENTQGQLAAAKEALRSWSKAVGRVLGRKYRG
ncbi:MAG: putative nucleic acid-binding Zn-ribbon protein [Glaciecola sp.]|jgi:predicted  nucleic acid-binding Zn-ribbon protein